MLWMAGDIFRPALDLEIIYTMPVWPLPHEFNAPCTLYGFRLNAAPKVQQQAAVDISLFERGYKSRDGG